jgi:predicted dehydrogenase
MRELRAGVVGVGHLGRHHARILATMPGVRLVAVADARIEQARAIAEPSGALAFESPERLPRDLDLVSIAVPTAFHREVASPFLERGIATLVEKPLAPTAADSEALVDLARRSGAILQVGHIERFNPIWTHVRPAAPHYLFAERLGVFTGRSTDIGVVLDMMIHDIDLILSIVSAPVASVSALGVSLFGPNEDVANARLAFVNGTIVDLSASRASMQASRKMRLWGGDGYLTIDFAGRKACRVRPGPRAEPGRIELRGVDFSKPGAVKEHIFGEVFQVTEETAPEGPEPLALELGDFVQAVRNGSTPRVSGEDALRAVQLAERILQCIRTHRWDGDRDDSRIGPHVRRDSAVRHSVPPEPHVLRAAARDPLASNERRRTSDLSSNEG